MNCATVSVEANGERGEDGAAVRFRAAVDRFVDMLKAGLDRNAVPGKERELRRAARQAFERGEAVGDGELPDRVHFRVKLERGDSGARVADLGKTKADLRPYVCQRISRHCQPPLNGSSLKKVKGPLQTRVG